MAQNYARFASGCATLRSIAQYCAIAQYYARFCVIALKSFVEDVDQFLISHGLQLQDPLIPAVVPDDDVDLLNLADVETFVVSSHRDLDHSSHYRPFSASPSAADSHSLAVSEPNAALLYSSQKNLELAPVAVVSPRHDHDHSSNSRPFSASSLAADSHPRPVLF